MTEQRLRSFGDLFKGSWQLYKQKFAALAALLVVVFLLNVISVVARGNNGSVHPLYLLVLLVALVLVLWIQAAIVYAIDSAGDQPDFPAIFQKSWAMVGSLFLVGLLVLLAVLGGFILLIVPAFIFAVWFSFSTFTLLLEDKHGREALKASKALVHGRFGAVLGRYCLLILCLLGFSIVFGIVSAAVPGLHSVQHTAIGSSQVGLTLAGSIASALFSSFLVTPLSVVFSYLLYKELKANPAPAAPAKS